LHGVESAFIVYFVGCKRDSARFSLHLDLEAGFCYVQWIDQSIGDDGSSGASYGTPPRREFGLFCGHDVSWGRVARGSAERSLRGEGDEVRSCRLRNDVMYDLAIREENSRLKVLSDVLKVD